MANASRTARLRWYLAAAILSVGALVAGCDPQATSVAGMSAGANPQFTAFERDGPDTSNDRPRLQVIKNPTVDQIMEAGPLGDRSMGRATAPVTVIEYASLTCPHCRAFHERTWPSFKRKYIDTGKVRYILREFPIGRSSGNAWLVTRCAPAGKFFRLYDAYLKRQGLWVSQEVRTEKIWQVAKGVGVSRATFDKCLQDQATIDHIKAVKDRGRQLGVIGTPTFFIGGKQYRSILTIEEIGAAIEAAKVG